MKRISTLFISLIITSSFSYAQTNFIDLPDNHWAKSSIEKLVSTGLMKGYEDGSIKPNASITRAEFVTMINSMMKYTEKIEKTKFKDISSSSWYYEKILIAEKQDYITGFEDYTFRPNENITREQVCTILAKVMQLVDLPTDIKIKDDISLWATSYVKKIISNRIMSLDKNGNFNAKKFATRADVADALSKFLYSTNLDSKKDNSKNQKNDENLLKKEEKKQPTPSGGGGGGASTQPSTNVEETKNGVTKNEANESVKNIIDDLTESSNKLEIKSENQKNFINDVKLNMQDYLNDNSIDISDRVNNIKSKYFSVLTEEERKDLKTRIGADIGFKDLDNAQKYFNLDIY